MAKEIFKINSTGYKVVFFHWKNISDNEGLSKFLGENFSIQDSTLKYKGLYFPLQTNSYFYKSDNDDSWELLFPEDMIKEYSYIGDSVSEEKSAFHAQDEEFKKKKTGHGSVKVRAKYKIEKECPVLGDSQKDNLYKLIKFHSKFENFICELEDEYNISVTKHFWEEFERKTCFKKDDSRYDVAEVLSDFPFEKYLKSEEEQKEFIFSVFEFSDETEKWYKGPNSESTENYMKTLYSDEQGTIIFKIQRYYDGRILELEFVTDRAEYNPYY